VDIRFYGSQSALYTALKGGEIDFMQWSLTPEQRDEIESNPDFAIASYAENGMSEFDFNNNYTIADYPGIKNPLFEADVRRAITCAVDKDYIVEEILEGAGTKLPVAICAPQLGWAADCADPFPWRFNMTKAEELLANAGFVDTEPDGVLNYPAGWPGASGQPNMHSLKVYIRTEDKRLDAGRYLKGQLDLLGIPHDSVEATSDVIFPIVMADRNYHIYTGGWNLGRYPTYLYGLFHQSYWFPDGSNYVTGMNSSNLPNYPELDTFVRSVYFAPDKATAQEAAENATKLGWCDLAVNCPLWSYTSYVAWNKQIAGVINMKGYGYDNDLQFINAYKSGGSIIRMGTQAAPKALNQLYSTWYYDYALLDRMFDGLLSVNPYNLAQDQPWAVQDWEVSTWIDPNPGPDEPAEKYKLTYYLRKDVAIVASNGTYMRNLDAHDLAFSCWYSYCFDDAWNWPSYQDVHHTKIIDQFTIEWYFEDISWLMYSSPQYPLFAKTELIDTLCTTSSVSFASDGTNCTTDTQFELPNGGEQIVQVTSDDLTVDYTIFGGYETYTHNWIWLHGDLPAGTYTIDYYTDDLDPHGFYLAGLDWTETWYSTGPFYPISIDPTVGGYASLNKNPYFWLGESPPPLGETDWRWVWDTPGGDPGPEVPGRDSGHYEISIYDVVKATGSYDSDGTGPYDANYFPGADLDGSDLGHIGIYDVVSITGKYGLEWGQPPL
jgi:hypothetical protein